MELQATLAIGSRLDNVDLAQRVVEETLSGFDLVGEDAYAVGMAVREAVTNAIRHGNQGDPAKRVVVSFGVEESEIVVRVEDQGRGFDPGRVPDPTRDENLMRSNGRGLLFMRRFMDRIDYTFRADGGTIVTLRKRLHEGDAALL